MSHVYLVEPSEVCGRAAKLERGGGGRGPCDTLCFLKVQGRCALRKVLSAGPEGIKRVKVNNNSFTIDDNLFRFVWNLKMS